MTDSTEQTTESIESNKRIGRPEDSDLAPHPDRKRPGPKAGDAAVMKWYKSRMLASKQSRKVFDAVMKTASDPDHKHFTACAKMVMDRLLPLGAFDKEAGKNSGGVKIEINVVGDTQVSETIEDAEYEEVEASS